MAPMAEKSRTYLWRMFCWLASASCSIAQLRLAEFSFSARSQIILGGLLADAVEFLTSCDQAAGCHGGWWVLASSFLLALLAVRCLGCHSLRGNRMSEFPCLRWTLAERQQRFLVPCFSLLVLLDSLNKQENYSDISENGMRKRRHRSAGCPLRGNRTSYLRTCSLSSPAPPPKQEN